jgi:hypothetical protein
LVLTICGRGMLVTDLSIKPGTEYNKFVFREFCKSINSVNPDSDYSLVAEAVSEEKYHFSFNFIYTTKFRLTELVIDEEIYKKVLLEMVPSAKRFL